MADVGGGQSLFCCLVMLLKLLLSREILGECVEKGLKTRKRRNRIKQEWQNGKKEEKKERGRESGTNGRVVRCTPSSQWLLLRRGLLRRGVRDCHTAFPWSPSLLRHSWHCTQTMKTSGSSLHRWLCCCFSFCNLQLHWSTGSLKGIHVI